MTVQATARYAGPFAGNGATTVFAFGFKVFAASDIVVASTVVATGVVSIPINGTDYTVQLNADQNANPGGQITYAVAPPNTVSFYITSTTPKAQGSSFPNPGPWNPTTAESAWDKAMVLTQEIGQAALLFAPGDVASAHVLPTPAARAGRLLGFDAVGLLSTFIVQVGTSLVDLASSIGSSLVGFIQSGAGAAIRSVQDKERDFISNFDFMTLAQITDVRNQTLAIDVTAAMQAALNNLSARVTTNTLAYAGGFGQVLDVPAGRLKLTSTLTIPANLSRLRIRGAGIMNTIWQPTGAFPVFTATSTQFVTGDFENMMFIGGTKAITIQTNNNDEATINFKHCAFYNQTTGAIEALSGSNSTQLTATECIFHCGAGGYAISSFTDYTKVQRCWVFTTAAVPVFFNMSGTLELTSLLGVPVGGYDSSQSCWVQNWGHLTATECRFGSEDGAGRPVFWNKATFPEQTIKIEKCFVPCADYHYKFDLCPEHLVIRENYGYGQLGGIGGKGMWFAAGAATNIGLMSRGTWLIEDLDFPGSGYFYSDGTTLKRITEIAHAKIMSQRNEACIQQVLYADMKLAMDGTSNIMIDEVLTNVTSGTGAYPLLGGFTAKKLTATADHAAYNGSDQTSQVAAIADNSGIYTYVFDCYVTGASKPFWLDANVRGTVWRRQVYNGLNIFCFKGQPISDNQVVRTQFFDIQNAVVILIGRWRFMAGIKDVRTVEIIYSDLTGGTIPNNAFTFHKKGDKVHYADAAAAAAPGAQCTTAGQPGTFKAMAILAA